MTDPHWRGEWDKAADRSREQEKVERPTIAIITDDPAFANTLTRRWLQEREVPAFVVLQGDSNFRGAMEFDLAVVVRVSPERLIPAVDTLNHTRKPAVLVTSLDGASPKGPNLTVLPEVNEWPDLVVTLTQQILRLRHIANELAQLHEMNTELQREASLGRYMLEVRHNLNNALTSVLGNSDLILLDADELPASLRSQVETIRNMSMRMNEILQRFSSLQKEMQLMERQNGQKARSTTAGA
jgi:signal transduction histidine kinase